MDHYDDLETRAPEAREAALLAALPEQVARAQSKAPGFAEVLAGVDAAAVTSRTALAQLPVTRKTDLQTRQAAVPPFGGLNALPVDEVARFFASPGPIYEFEAARPGFWRLERALFAAGFRAGDRVHNCFAYHLTPGGWMMDGAARSLGCAVIPGGVGNSEQQVQAIAHFRPGCYTGTPDFLKVLLDKAAELGLDCSSITRALVSGGALFPEMRRAYAEQGVSVLQCYATADLGLIAYESEAREGMILDEEIIVEILRPGTGDPLPEGEVGEVVVTTLNPDYPLIRFATGDLSAILPGTSPCGRTAPRIKGWMGRADQATKVKGMFVQPSQVAAVLRRHPEIQRARLVVVREGASDAMTLACEVAAPVEGLSAAIAATLREACKLGGAVDLVAPDSLPKDGKVIDDQRSYDS
jgi:phenylacetate-CoA ligase